MSFIHRPHLNLDFKPRSFDRPLSRGFYDSTTDIDISLDSAESFIGRFCELSRRSSPPRGGESRLASFRRHGWHICAQYIGRHTRFGEPSQSDDVANRRPSHDRQSRSAFARLCQGRRRYAHGSSRGVHASASHVKLYPRSWLPRRRGTQSAYAHRLPRLRRRLPRFRPRHDCQSRVWWSVLYR